MHPSLLPLSCQFGAFEAADFHGSPSVQFEERVWVEFLEGEEGKTVSERASGGQSFSQAAVSRWIGGGCSAGVLCGKKKDDDSYGGKLVGHRFSLKTEENSSWGTARRTGLQA